MWKYKKVHEIKSDRELYTIVGKEFGSKIAKLLFVSVLEEEQEFKSEFAALIKPYYKKNLVSLSSEIQAVYESASIKRQWIEDVLVAFYDSLKSSSQYPDGELAESPSEYLWSLYILAQHYGMEFSTLEKAHYFIQQAIAHTNTVSEFYIVKA